MGRAVAAFLKGVNVGGNKKIKMEGLRQAVAGVGCQDVRTYLQSGNVVFTCDRKDLGALPGDIEDSIEKVFGFKSKVILRDARSLLAGIGADPLTAIATNPSRHLIGFLAEAPSAKAARAAEDCSTSTDVVSVVGKHLYMWCPEGISASPLFRVNFDRVLGTAVTMRNWTTANKVAQMLGDLAP